MSSEGERSAIEMGKFELCTVDYGCHPRSGVHGMNAFTVSEMKGRRRMVAEPHLNSVIWKQEFLPFTSPGRLEHRQGLRYAK